MDNFKTVGKKSGRFSELIKRLKLKSEFGRNVLTLMTGSTIAQVIPITISPILTRIYSPDDFGLFALYMAIVSSITVFATGRYELAIMLPKKNDDALQVACLAIMIAIVISILLLFAVVIFNTEIIHLINNEDISPWLYMLPLSVLVSGLILTFNYWHNRKKRFYILTKNRVLQSGGTGLVQLGFGNLQLAGGLVWGTVLGQIISLGQLLKIFWKHDRQLSDCNYLKMIVLGKRYIKFPIIDVPTTFTNVVANQVPNILLATMFSPSVAGFFYLTQRVLQVPITLFSTSVLDVFKQRASEDYKKYKSCRDIFKRTFLMLLFIITPISFVLFFLIEDLFTWVFGVQWHEAGTYAQILIPALSLRFVVSPLSFIIYIAEKQIWNFFCMIGLLFGMIYSIYYAGSAIQAVELISISYVIYYLVHLAISAVLSGLFKQT